jgi:putative transcriptional regulator
MQFVDELSDEAVLVALGDRIARYRLNRNMTQKALAAEAGVSPRTLHRIEHGQSAQVTNLIRLLRAFNLLENLDALIPGPTISPIQQAKMLGKTRKRASSPAAPSGTNKPWTWGDEE